MKKITEVTRRDLFDIIQEGFNKKAIQTVNSSDCYYVPMPEDTHVFMTFSGRFSTYEFLNRLYSLDQLPSTDSRFKNAKGDISCHTVSFDDWPEFWFLDDVRFELTDGFDDEPILKFLCEMLHPAVREDDSVWQDYLRKFNEILRRDGYEIYSSYRISGKDVFKAREYIVDPISLSEKDLFSCRYKELISYENGTQIDNICENVPFHTKENLISVLEEFAAPTLIKPDRYSNYEISTDAMYISIQRLNRVLDCPAINLLSSLGTFGSQYENQLKDLFSPFLFDLIELQHDVLAIEEKEEFRGRINAEFVKENCNFLISDYGLIEKQIEYAVLNNRIGEEIGAISEPGLRDLLDEAIELHQHSNLSDHKAAMEKIWDAFERLKSYYTALDKRASSERIVADMANEERPFIDLFTDEFRALTTIGNKLRIRHHETDKIDIGDAKYFDYFFNRCLTLIALAIQYLK